MKKYGKLSTAVLSAVGAALLMSTAAFASSDAEYIKNENIYVRLEQDGDINGTYVVNAFKVSKAGEVTDYGDYSKVQNLTDLSEIKSDKNEHSFYAEDGKFYYQGDIEKARLPWEFDIVYTLDGDEVENEELAGASGDLEIRLKIRKNPAFTDDRFFAAYMLQVSFTLDPELCDKIKTNGASVSDAGANENITFIVNPETETDLIITAEVENFEMDDISINGVAAVDMPLSFVSEDNSNMGKTSFLISAEGVKIPEPEPEQAPAEGKNFWEKLLDLLKELFGF